MSISFAPRFAAGCILKLALGVPLLLPDEELASDALSLLQSHLKPEITLPGPELTAKYFGNVPVIGLNRQPELALPEKRTDWMIMFPEEFTRENLTRVCEEVLPPLAKCSYIGHPGTGLPVITAYAEESEMHMTFSMKPVGATYVELDGPTKALDLKVSGSAGRTGSRYFPYNPVPWNLDRIDGRQGFDGKYGSGDGGNGIHIYHLDTGVTVTNPEFEGRAVPTIEALGNGVRVCFPVDITCAGDNDGHGTHTAGIIGSRTYGVAKKSIVHAVKVLNDNGSGAFSWFVTAVDWIMAFGIHPAVVSASLGGRGNVLTVKNTIDTAVNRGLVVVVAAGNEGQDACQYSPSFVKSAITVGSTDWHDSISPFSNYGPCLDLFAPGSGIVSIKPYGGMQTMSGTSMSAPHVAAAVSLFWARSLGQAPAPLGQPGQVGQMPGQMPSQVPGQAQYSGTRMMGADDQFPGGTPAAMPGPMKGAMPLQQPNWWSIPSQMPGQMMGPMPGPMMGQMPARMMGQMPGQTPGQVMPPRQMPGVPRPPSPSYYPAAQPPRAMSHTFNRAQMEGATSQGFMRGDLKRSPDKILYVGPESYAPASYMPTSAKQVARVSAEPSEEQTGFLGDPNSLTAS